MAQNRSRSRTGRAAKNEALRGQCLLTFQLMGQGDIWCAVLTDAIGRREIVWFASDDPAADEHDLLYGSDGDEPLHGGEGEDLLYGRKGRALFECQGTDEFRFVMSRLWASAGSGHRVAEPSRQELLSSTVLNRTDAVQRQADAEGTGSSAAKEELEQLLAAATQQDSADEAAQGSTGFDEDVFRSAVRLLGGDSTLGASIQSELDLLRAIVRGFPSGVIGRLREAGFSSTVLEDVVAPRRTLARRKAERQRLTQGESDAAWRLAHVLALASHVLDGTSAAHAWLGRRKSALADEIPLALLNTSVGARAVERLLRQLEWGDVA